MSLNDWTFVQLFRSSLFFVPSSFFEYSKRERDKKERGRGREWGRNHTEAAECSF